MEENIKQITMKVTKEEKETIEEASSALGLGQSSFCRSTTLEKARKLLKELKD